LVAIANSNKLELAKASLKKGCFQMGIALADVKYRTQRIAYICVYILNVKNANIEGRKEHLNVNGFNLFIYILSHSIKF
jgi:hypothetical protein